MTTADDLPPASRPRTACDRDVDPPPDTGVIDGHAVSRLPGADGCDFLHRGRRSRSTFHLRRGLPRGGPVGTV